MRADPAYSVASGQISPSQGQQKKQKHPERERFLALGEQGRWEQEEEFHQEGDRHQAVADLRYHQRRGSASQLSGFAAREQRGALR